MDSITTQPFGLIRRNKKLIIFTALVFATAAVIFALKNKPRYIATTSFSLEDSKSSGTGGLLGLASQFGFDLGGEVGGVFSGDNIIALFKTRRIIEAALLRKIDSSNKLLVEELYFDILKKGNDIENSRYKGFSFARSQNSKQYQFLQDSLLGDLYNYVARGYVQVEKPDKKLNIIMVTCKTPGEQFSKTLCDFLVDEVSKFYVETKVGRAKKNVDILQNRADSLRAVYSSKLLGRAAVSDANVNPLFQTPQVGILEKQTDINVLVTAYAEVVKNLEVSKFSLMRETPLIQIIDSPKLPLEEKRSNFILYGLAGAFAGAFIIVSILMMGLLFRVYFTNKS